MSIISGEHCSPSPATSIESLDWDTLSEPITEDFQEFHSASDSDWKLQIAEMHIWLKRREQLAYSGLDTVYGWEENYLTMKAKENKVTQLEASNKLNLLNNIIAIEAPLANDDIKVTWAILMINQRLLNLMIHSVNSECTLERRLDLVQKMFCAADVKGHSTQDIWSENIKIPDLKSDLTDADYNA